MTSNRPWPSSPRQAACTASGGTEQPATRACRRVVQKFGPVTAFSYKGKTLSAEELAACNA